MLISTQIHSNNSQPIPTNVITGFLGVGKTTSIRHLLANKPDNERWAVLVNEFGEIGIDGAMLEDSNAEIKEIPGGCICCVAGLPMKIALNKIITKTKPDRILIEPTGLGHARDIIASLTDENYLSVLELKATITLVDPRKLADTRYTENDIFQDQIAVADVLIANKSDLLTETDKTAFEHLLANANPPKKAFGYVTQGEIPLEYLDLARQELQLDHKNSSQTKLKKQDAYNTKIQLADDQDFMRKESRNQDFFATGWLFKPELCFDFNALFGWLSGLPVLRAKAVMNTDQGVYSFNAENGVLSVNSVMLEASDLTDSRIEFIDDKAITADDYEKELLAKILKS